MVSYTTIVILFSYNYCSIQFLLYWNWVSFVTTTTSRAVTVSTRGCTYRLPGSFRQFPLRGSNYADPADIQMLRLVLGSPAGGLGIMVRTVGVSLAVGPRLPAFHW